MYSVILHLFSVVFAGWYLTSTGAKLDSRPFKYPHKIQPAGFVTPLVLIFADSREPKLVTDATSPHLHRYII